MSDIEKLEAATNKLQNLIDWAKQNTMLVGILITVVPAIFVAGYQGITKFNEVKAMYEDFDSVSTNASVSKRKVEALEERVTELRETNLKLQERLNYAVMDAREAKVVSESVQKELRAGLAAQKVELDSTAASLKSEMNALKRASTNRLGN
jgi:hypothetical protein